MRDICVSALERFPMYIPLNMNNIRKTKNKELSENHKGMIWILLDFVVMAIMFWFILISSSVPEYREPQLATEAVCNIPGIGYLIGAH